MLISITTTSSCEEGRAAHLAAEEERAGPLEVSAEDQGSVALEARCNGPCHECKYRHECDFEISWLCLRVARTVAREKSRW